MVAAPSATQRVPHAEEAAEPNDDGSCPAAHPVKALQADRAGARRYLLPADAGYATAAGAICYTSEETATAAGFQHAAP